jgi:hypothetical protein
VLLVLNHLLKWSERGCQPYNEYNESNMQQAGDGLMRKITQMREQGTQLNVSWYEM